MTRGARLSAFGLAVDADFPLPGGRAEGHAALTEELTLTRVEPDDLLPLVGQPRQLRLLHSFDDCPYAMLEGPAGDVLMCYGFRALFHLSEDRRLLRCAPTVDDDPYWQRVLLDTVLWTVSLLRGFELLHASAVETGSGLVAFVTTSGGGKTSLAAEFLRRGARLFSDDIVAIGDVDGQLLAFPGPQVMNLPSTVAPGSVGGEALADFGEERWVELLAPPPASQGLSTVVLVDRAPGLEAACSAIEGTSLTVLPHTLGLSHLPERAKRRFEVIGRVAATARLLHLTADPTVPTGVLADLVEARIAAS